MAFLLVLLWLLSSGGNGSERELRSASTQALSLTDNSGDGVGNASTQSSRPVSPNARSDEENEDDMSWLGGVLFFPLLAAS